eukprot:15358138-Ditylum_brightwellii.AAC.1
MQWHINIIHNRCNHLLFRTSQISHSTNHTKAGISKTEGINSIKDTSKAKVIMEEVTKEVEEVDKVAVVAVDMVAVDKEREILTPPSTVVNTEVVPIGVTSVNARHRDTVPMQHSKIGWEVITGIVTAEGGEQKMISMNR